MRCQVLSFFKPAPATEKYQKPLRELQAPKRMGRVGVAVQLRRYGEMHLETRGWIEAVPVVTPMKAQLSRARPQWKCSSKWP